MISVDSTACHVIKDVVNDFRMRGKNKNMRGVQSIMTQGVLYIYIILYILYIYELQAVGCLVCLYLLFCWTCMSCEKMLGLV